MAKTGVSMNWSGLDKAVGGAVDALDGRRKELMQNIGEALVSSTKQRFADEKGPDGAEWKKSARASAGGGKTLTDTARLKQSISAKTALDTVYVGTNLEYARIHQLGGEIKPKSKKKLKFQVDKKQWRTADKVTMPARPYLGISEEDKEEISGTISDFLKSAFEG